MSISHQTISLMSPGSDAEGALIYWNGKLAAVMSKLTDADHGEYVGQWFLEAGFGGCPSQYRPFATFEQACEQVRRWVEAEAAESAIA